MCKFASFVLTKDREFWSDTSDSHEQIIAENNLHADGARGPNVLRVELSPTDKIKVWPSLKAWAYKVDQDRMPEWFDAATAEKRARTALACRYRVGFTSVDASGCTSLTSLDAANATGYVDASGCTSLTSLDAANAGYRLCERLHVTDQPRCWQGWLRRCERLHVTDQPRCCERYWLRLCERLHVTDQPRCWQGWLRRCERLHVTDQPRCCERWLRRCERLHVTDQPRCWKAGYVDASGCDPKLVIKARKGATVIK